MSSILSKKIKNIFFLPQITSFAGKMYKSRVKILEPRPWFFLGNLFEIFPKYVTVFVYFVALEPFFRGETRKEV